MLAQVLGSGLTFRQTLLACLMSFTTFALVVGSLSPLVFFMVLNTPAPTDAGAAQWHAIFLLANTSIVAYAGVVANYKMLSVLDEMTGDRRVALKVLMAWLAGNLFVGAQLSWNLRPFFGNPSLGVQFLRDEPFRGNFYQDVVEKVSSLIELGGGAVPLFALALITAVLVGAVLFPTRTQAGRTPHRNGTRQGDKDAPPGRR
jgi:hypothetical protein